MNLWYYLWITIFVASTVSFALIAVVVSIRGVSDLRTMLRGLEAAQSSRKANGPTE